MRKFTLCLLILSVIFGFTMCEDTQTNTTNNAIDKNHSKMMEDLVEQFKHVQNTNDDLDKQIFEALEDETAKHLSVTAIKFLSLLNNKQAVIDVQIENLDNYQKLASEFISSNSN